MLLVFQVFEFKRERGKPCCSSVKGNLSPSRLRLPASGCCAVPPSLTLPSGAAVDHPLYLTKITLRSILSLCLCSSAFQRSSDTSERDPGSIPLAEERAEARPSQILSNHVTCCSIPPCQHSCNSVYHPHHKTENVFKL